MASIAPQSIMSLQIQMHFQGALLGTGTGFVANSSQGPVLITNRHNVTGRHNLTNQPLSETGGIPDELGIFHNSTERLGTWLFAPEPLYTDGTPLWKEHPTLGAQADFVALPLTNLEHVQLYPYDLHNTGPAISCGPADVVSVIGFPFGIHAGGFSGGRIAIWATGFVASDPDIDYNNLPIFLIDCRSRPGQSGSAVIAHRSGGLVPLEDGSSVGYSGPVHRFLGIYSGRINEQSDIGLVWKASALRELIESI